MQALEEIFYLRPSNFHSLHKLSPYLPSSSFLNMVRAFLHQRRLLIPEWNGIYGAPHLELKFL